MIDTIVALASIALLIALLIWRHAELHRQAHVEQAREKARWLCNQAAAEELERWDRKAIAEAREQAWLGRLR